MEYALRVSFVKSNENNTLVLILVLMEYALREELTQLDENGVESLNPCFNGICSASSFRTQQRLHQDSLNPCFNGICSASQMVLCHIVHIVLILVLMEYALRESLLFADRRKRPRLNPCFNGICSASVVSWTLQA